jgi:sugar phosphate isomerase/epimerase
VAALLDHAKGRGVPLALEALHPMYAANRSCISTVKQALDMCEAIAPDSPAALGVAIDIYHCWWDPDVYAQIARAGASKRILGFHLSDWLRDTQDLLVDRGMMGDGVADLPRLRRAVEQAGYAGPHEVEIFSRDNWWKQDEEVVIRTCAERLQTVC